MIEFQTASNIPERHVACRLSMIAGISGPLAWESPDEICTPAYPQETEKNTWDVGAGFTLIILNEHDGLRTCRLTHPELTHTLRDLQRFLEWTFDNSFHVDKNSCCDIKQN